MKYLLLFLTVLSLKSAAQADSIGIKTCINNLFEGMRKADTSLVRSAFTQQAVLETMINRQDTISVLREPLDSFLVQVGKPHPEVYDERIRFEMIKIDGDLASVWTPYQFFIGNRFSHCGVDSYQLVRINGNWKIQYLIDTRRRQGCQ